MKEKFKSGFVALIGRPNVGKIYINESDYWSEDSNNIKKTTDYKKIDTDSIHM